MASARCGAVPPIRTGMVSGGAPIPGAMKRLTRMLTAARALRMGADGALTR